MSVIGSLCMYKFAFELSCEKQWARDFMPSFMKKKKLNLRGPFVFDLIFKQISRIIRHEFSHYRSVSF